MATQPATPINRTKRDWIEAKAPEMFKFTQQGQELMGVLVNIEPTVVKGPEGRESHTIEYTMVDLQTADRITFLGTNDLNKKIVPGHIGHCIAIRYERDDDSFTKPGQNAAKVFKVMVTKDKEPGF